jgi:hypothetical protein
MTMGFYIAIPDSDEFDSLLPLDSEDWDVFERFDGRPLAASWSPVPVKVYVGKRRGDFPSLLADVPVFSERALHVLGPLMGSSIEALPLQCKKGSFYAINVLEVVAALDQERSEIDRFPDGRVMDVERYVLQEDLLQGRDIFKLAEVTPSRVFVSEAFKKSAEENGLQGLIFKPVDRT